jgi:hypothetical protein
MKVCVLIIFLVLPWISRVGDWALGWTEGNEKLQIIFVMMLFPLIMNALQYYIIDSFIKNQHTEHEPLASDDPDGRAGVDSGYGGRRRSESDDGVTLEDEEADGKGHRAARQAREDEYDPDLDGDAPTVIGSSSSGTTQHGRLLPRELYPKE